MNDTIELLLNHRSVRHFTGEPVTPETLAEIVTCAQMAPSSSHIQAYTIIEVTDPHIRSGIRKVSGDQRWVTESPSLLVFCADLHRPGLYFEGLDETTLGNTEFLVTAVVDVALAAQKALIAAQSLGLGGVIVGGIRNDVARISELLQLPKLVFPVFAMCLGFPASQPDRKPRLPQPVILRRNHYDEPSEAELVAAYDSEMREYYADRESGSHDACWTQRCGSLLSSKRRDEVDADLKKAGFLKQK